MLFRGFQVWNAVFQSLQDVWLKRVQRLPKRIDQTYISNFQGNDSELILLCLIPIHIRVGHCETLGIFMPGTIASVSNSVFGWLSD